MSFFHSPRIVTDGLRLYVDAANPKCYPGSGTNLDDLVNNSISGSMTGITYNTNNLGTFDFDSTDVIDMGLPSSLQSAPGALFAWIRPDSWSPSFGRIVNFYDGTGYNFIMDNSSITSGFGLITNSATSDCRVSNTITLNVWQQVGFTFDGTQSIGSRCTLFHNGVQVTKDFDDTVTPTFTSSGNYYIGNSGAGDRVFDGEIAIVMEYDRALTEQEVLQNFNALRGRFGI